MRLHSASEVSKELGVEKLEQLISCAIEVIQIGFDVMEDGKIGLGDVPEFYKAYKHVRDAVEIFPEARMQLADLDEAEALYIKTKIKQKFDIPNDKIEETIETALDWIYNIVQMLGILKKK